MKNIDCEGIIATTLSFLVGISCWTVLIAASLHMTNII